MDENSKKETKLSIKIHKHRHHNKKEIYLTSDLQYKLDSDDLLLLKHY